MKHFAIRYAAIVASLLFLFGNFVACGAQMYKISIEEDVVYVQEPEGMKDPDHPNFGLQSPNGWKSLPIRFRVGSTLSDVQKRGLLRAMSTWESAVGRKLFAYEGVHKDVDGDNFVELFDSLPDQINGHYLDRDWTKTGKPNNVLATTIWDPSYDDPGAISTADIRFNGHYYIIGDAFKDQSEDERAVVDMETLALHELGHLLGLGHMSAKSDPYSIMLPEVYVGEGLTNRRLSVNDIHRIQRIYGCDGTACNAERTLALLEQHWTKEETEGVTLPATAH